MRVRSLSQEDLLEEGLATHSSIPAWRIPWTEEPGRLQSRRVTESDTTEQLPMHCRRQENRPPCTKVTFTCQSLEPVIITFYKQKM